MTEREIFNCLRSKFGGNDFALLPQVRSTTGAGAARTADAIAVSLWPSRGIDVHGFEFKDSRADWLRELKKPVKADEIAPLCSYWHVVFSDEKHFKADEVPAPWGILVCNAGGVAEVRKPKRNDEPKPPTWLFLAAVLRRCSAEKAGEDEIAAAVAKAVEVERSRIYEDKMKDRERFRNEGLKQYKELNEKVLKFEAESGVNIGATWQSDRRIGQAVKLVLGGGLEAKVAEMQRLKENCDRISKELAAALAEISTPPGPVT